MMAEKVSACFQPYRFTLNVLSALKWPRAPSIWGFWDLPARRSCRRHRPRRSALRADTCAPSENARVIGSPSSQPLQRGGGLPSTMLDRVHALAQGRAAHTRHSRQCCDRLAVACRESQEPEPLTSRQCDKRRCNAVDCNWNRNRSGQHAAHAQYQPCTTQAARKEQPPSHNTMLVIPVGIRKERAVTESPWPHLLPTSHHRYDLLSSQPE